MASRQLEYFYSTHSTYAYIGAMRFQEICATFDCAPVHRPFDFLPVVEHAGGLPFAARTQAHVDYFFGREIERWSVYRDVPIIDHRPTHHDNPLSLSSGMVISAAQSGLDVNALSLAIHQAHWRDDLDLMDLSVLENAAESVGLDARPLLEDAMSPSVKGIFAENTQAAIDRGFLGSPTYVLDGDPYYGQDHLELLARALERPFPPTSFRNPSVAGV